MKRIALAFLVVLAFLVALTPGVAHADGEPCAPAKPCTHAASEVDPLFPNPMVLRTLVGMGAAFQLPADDRAAAAFITAEVGGHPLTGAFGTGFSVSTAIDFRGLWSVFTPGIFAKLDLTYLLLSGLWRVAPSPESFSWAHVQVGGRLGLAISESKRPSEIPYSTQYFLLRPELETFLDVEWAHCKRLRDIGLTPMIRGALDTSVNYSDMFRWSVSLGLNYGWK
jgi:hypothetical protein